MGGLVRRGGGLEGVLSRILVGDVGKVMDSPQHRREFRRSSSLAHVVNCVSTNNTSRSQKSK